LAAGVGVAIAVEVAKILNVYPQCPQAHTSQIHVSRQSRRLRYIARDRVNGKRGNSKTQLE